MLASHNLEWEGITMEREPVELCKGLYVCVHLTLQMRKDKNTGGV